MGAGLYLTMTSDRPHVTLARIAPQDIGQLSHFTLPPDQAGFADLPPVSMANAPDRDGHVILADGVPAGFFGIDTTYAAGHTFAPTGSIGVRMFMIDHAQQGRGIASAACRAMPAYLAAEYPQAPSCWLTVNCRNPGARTAYLRGGFRDTKELYLDGGFGPQHIMCLDLAQTAMT